MNLPKHEVHRRHKFSKVMPQLREDVLWPCLEAAGRRSFPWFFPGKDVKIMENPLETLRDFLCFVPRKLMGNNPEKIVQGGLMRMSGHQMCFSAVWSGWQSQLIFKDRCGSFTTNSGEIPKDLGGHIFHLGFQDGPTTCRWMCWETPGFSHRSVPKKLSVFHIWRFPARHGIALVIIDL